MARDGKVDQLARVSLFQGLSHKELQAVAAAADIVGVPADNDIVVEGTPAELKRRLPPAKIEYVERQPTLEEIFLATVGDGPRSGPAGTARD